MKNLGFAGRIAQLFLRSKLTPVLIIAITIFGCVAIAFTPRQENPQITLPAAVVTMSYHAQTSDETQELITKPLERILREVPGIEHLYAVSSRESTTITLLFTVGNDPTQAFTALRSQLAAHVGELPTGATPPLVTPLSSDDLPIAVISIHGKNYTRQELGTAADRFIERLEPIPGVSTITTTGASIRRVNVLLDPSRLASYGLSPVDVARSLSQTDVIGGGTALLTSKTSVLLHAGENVQRIQDVATQTVAVKGGAPVLLGDLATIVDGADGDDSRTLYNNEPAVSIALAKAPGTNAVTITSAVREVIAQSPLPPGVTATLTRDDGVKANHAVNDLMHRLIEAIIIVTALLLVLGKRQAAVVAMAIPLTLFFTLGIGMLTHQSINRITLFALILSLGLLVDDAIVVVENIHRRYAGVPLEAREETTILAVDEIGRPTALATLTVVLSFLPMLFVSGMMGPYMRPIPLNVPVAMAASLFIAFAITPWATFHLMRNQPIASSHADPKWVRGLSEILRKLLVRPRRGSLTLAILGVAFIAALALPALALVQFRMLPRANETTFLVTVNARPGSSIDATARIAGNIRNVLLHSRNVASVESYVGVPPVSDLSSLFEGTMFRSATDQASLRVNLVQAQARTQTSAQIAREIRPKLAAAAQANGASIRILQTPPGPPVRDTILAKIYGPDPEVRRALATRVVSFFTREHGVVDLDASTKATGSGVFVRIDPVKAALAGVNVADAVRTLAIAVGGEDVGVVHVADARHPVAINLRFVAAARTDPHALDAIMLPSSHGLIALSTIVNTMASPVAEPRYREAYADVDYVGAEMAGRSSTYAVIDALFWLAHNPPPAGYRIEWGGEWRLTNVVFADLGSAMGMAFLIIYFVLTARFRSFRTPLVVMSAVPLAMIGIMPGFALLAPFGIYFSATAMIGFIALIGIVVRNSIILIEFIEDRLAEGDLLHDALVAATRARTRPILLTAAAGVLSSVVIAFDPVWSGLAWALVFGMSTSAILSLIAIPLLYERIGEPPTTPMKVISHA